MKREQERKALCGAFYFLSISLQPSEHCEGRVVELLANPPVLTYTDSIRAKMSANWRLAAVSQRERVSHLVEAAFDQDDGQI